MVSVIINHLENFFKNNKIGYQLSENIFSFTDPVNEGNEFPIYNGYLETNSSTQFVAEGFQMLSSYIGTFANPQCIARCPDNKPPYSITNDHGFCTLYNYLAFKIENNWILIGFIGSQKYQGCFRIYPDGKIEIFADTENVSAEKFPEQLLVVDAESLFECRKQFGNIINKKFPMLKADTSLTGWCSWYCCYEKVSEKDIAENLERLKLMPGFDYVLIDDGYQTHMGDWLRFSDKFPCGLPNVIKKIHEAGKKTAIWVAPFICSGESSLFKEHPEFLAKDKNGDILRPDKITYEGWRDLPWYSLDFSKQETRNYISHVFRYFYKELGITAFKLDSMYWGAIRGAKYHKNITGIENIRLGLETIQKATDGNAYILGCNAPLWPCIGMVHGMRLADDVIRWQNRFHENVKLLLNRLWMSKSLFQLDPDCICIQDLENQKASWDDYKFHRNSFFIFCDILMSGDYLNSLNEENINFLYECYKHRNDFKIEWQSDDLNTVICFHTENNLPITEKITVLPSENRILIEKIN